MLVQLPDRMLHPGADGEGNKGGDVMKVKEL